jgi:hypothetical protein
MIQYEPPFVVIPMPLDKDGRGPETDYSKCVKTVWQVWDSCNMTVMEYEDEGEAMSFCDLLNLWFK